MKLALIPAAFPSHVAAFDAVARALAARGHELVLIQRPEAAAWLRPGTPLAFAPAGGSGEPLARIVARAAHPSFPLGIRRVVRDMAEATARLARDLPAALARAGAEAAIADQMEPAAAIACDRLGLPFLSLAPALPLEPDPTLPLPMLSWRYDPSERGIHRNRGGLRIADMLMRPVHDAIAAASGGRWRRMEACISPLGSLWQLVPALDFPRRTAPAGSHYVGPLRAPEAEAEAAALPVPLRGGRPVVYASLGTLQGHRLGLFRRIARACRRVGAELVVSHCGCLPPEAAARIGADHVVADLPQRAMIAAADLVVTHGGMNTVLDAATAGRPMLVLPIAFDQPGVASRVEWAGAGLARDHRFATTARLAHAIATLLAEPRFAEASAVIGAQILQAPGAEGAAALAERALATGRPVERQAA